MPVVNLDSKKLEVKKLFFCDELYLYINIILQTKTFTLFWTLFDSD